MAKNVALQVGLFSIPVKLDPAVEKEAGNGHTVCTGGGTHPAARVRQHADCSHPDCNESHSSMFGYSERGVERDGGIVLLTKEEIAEAQGTPSKTMNLLPHLRSEVYANTLAGDSVQNVVPGKGGEKGYSALRTWLTERPDVVLATIWAPTSKNAFWVIELVEGRLVASKRAWPQDVRVVAEVAVVEVPEVEQKTLGMVLDTMLTPFDVNEYRDAARDGMAALLASRTDETVLLAVTPGAPVAGNDMLAALEATLAAAKPAKAPAKKRTKKAAA